MVVGAKVCELTDVFLWFVCGNFDASPKAVSPRSRKNTSAIYHYISKSYLRNISKVTIC